MQRRIVIVTFFAGLVVFFVIYYNYKTENEYDVNFYFEIEPSKATSNGTKLFDLDFKYLLNNDVCEAPVGDILAILIVTSYYGNVETRSAMRRSHPQSELVKLNLRRVFLLGEADDKYVSRGAILDENKKFRDLIQGNFKEAYRNLTYKHVMGLKWAATTCSEAAFIVKMDDDTVINVDKVVEFLKNFTNASQSDSNALLGGYVLQDMSPVREPANKWYVTYKEYSATTYPTFLSGWFYITNPATAARLLDVSSNVPYFWIDDVYVTGLLAQKIELQHRNLKRVFTVHSEFLQCCISDIRKLYECDLLAGPNGGDNNLFFSFNEAMRKCNHGECLKRPKPLDETCVAEKKFAVGRGDPMVAIYRLS